MGEQQDKHMMPIKGKVPPEKWQEAVRLTIKHVTRVTEANSNR